MEIVWILVGAGILVLVFLTLWLRERRRARIEYIAYGLRADEESDENTKTNITKMEASYVEAMTKLEELGQVKQDNWTNGHGPKPASRSEALYKMINKSVANHAR